MNGTEFIAVADQIRQFGPGGIRSATSRAYYGAFHVALEWHPEERAAYQAKLKSLFAVWRIPG